MFRHEATMRIAWVIAGCLLLTVSNGCRNRAAQELLERDLRVQEDIIYDLEDEVRALMSENESLRQLAFSGATLESSSSNEPTPAAPNSRSSTPTPSREPMHLPEGALAPDQLKPPTVERPMSRAAPQFEGPPAIVAPGEGFPEGELPTPAATPANSGSSTPAKNVSLGSSAQAGPTVAAPNNAIVPSEEVQTITLHESQSRGYNDDGQPGDDGIRVIVEPRNDAEQIVAAPAKISVVLMDPLLAGNAARIGRWDFTVEQAAMSYDKSDESEGLHLELPWYQTVPQHGELHLFVRYHTADGRKLDADRSLTIALRPLEQRTAPSTNSPNEPARSALPSHAPRAPARSAISRGTPPPGAAVPPGGRPSLPTPALPARRSPYSSAYDRVPATTQRSIWSRNPAGGPTARLLPPEFSGVATPLPPMPAPSPAEQEPAAPTTPPSGTASPTTAPAKPAPPVERPRVGATWSPNRLR